VDNEGRKFIIVYLFHLILMGLPTFLYAFVHNHQNEVDCLEGKAASIFSTVVCRVEFVNIEDGTKLILYCSCFIQQI
jgi:SNF family Na+-dependent transporter